MEAVRILKALGVQPRRTIRIALWSGEEQGLLGSRAYVRQHFAERQPTPQQQQQRDEMGRMMASMNPLGPLVTKPDHEKFSVYFNLDNGTGKIRGVYLQGNEAVRPIFRAWLAPFHDLGAATLTLQNTGGTDHTYERLQADDMKQAAVIMAAFVYNAAMRDEKLPRKPVR
jgi:hypothetical protein